MKSFIAALILVASCTAIAAADEFIEPVSPLWGWHAPRIVGSVKQITTTRHLLEGPAGAATGLPDATLDTFDDKGRLIERSGLAPSNGKPYPPTTVKFDDAGRPIEILFRSFTGEVSGSHVLTWDADGRGCKLVVNDVQTADHANVVRVTGDLKVNAQRRITQIKSTEGGAVTRYLFYAYTPDGALDSVLISTKPDPAEAMTKIVYQHNDKGLVATEEQLRGKVKFSVTAGSTVQWTPIETIEHIYTYDAAGNWVKRITATKSMAPNAFTMTYAQTLRTIEYRK